MKSLFLLEVRSKLTAADVFEMPSIGAQKQEGSSTSVILTYILYSITYKPEHTTKSHSPELSDLSRSHNTSTVTPRLAPHN